MWQIIGQDRIVTLLQNGLERKTLAHAYLLVGPCHSGKMTLALELAKALNCTGDIPPCGECAACQRIADGKHSDVQVIELVTNGESAEGRQRKEISTEQILQLQRTVSLPPFEGKCKVFIIDGAEQLSDEASNRLLKTLEEPVAGVVFILLTENEKLMPLTVVSRCQRLQMSLMPAKEAQLVLESRGLDAQKARLLARLSHGCLGWAISAMADDTLLVQRASKMTQMFDVMGTGYDEGFAYAAQLAESFTRDRGSAQEVLDLWLDCWRDLLLIKTSRTADVTNTDYLARLLESSKRLALVQIKDFIKNIQAAKQQLKLNASPRLVLEVLMLNMPRGNRQLDVSAARQG
ncbi:MAG: DNA polymerase III subunit delta' [Chloroflexi bacterium]|nr:DNA polymerase III subunit delta' [Chloroflexota bacterium]